MQRLGKVRSRKSFAENFLLNTMAGQKMFLYNEDIPRVINISFIEKKCMYKCRMCPYSCGDVREHFEKSSEMDIETLMRIVDSVPNDPYYSFDMSAVGETLEFDPLPEFIAYMKRKKPLVNTIVSTNGVLLDERLFTRLVASGLDNLQVSLFAENRDDHAFITGSKTFDRVKANLERAAEVKRRLGARKPFIQTFLLETRETTPSRQRFLDHWTPRVDKAFVRPLLKRGMDIQGLTPLYDFAPARRRRPCMQPWYSTAINSRGEVLPCYSYHWDPTTWGFSLGNIREKPLREIWKGPVFREFRRKHLAVDLDGLPACAKCASWNDYTDIWETEPTGSYKASPLAVRDFFTRVPAQRGG